MTATKQRYIIGIAGLFFVLSFALPSYDGRSGLECALVSVEAMKRVLFTPGEFNNLKELLFALYIGLFNITNLFTAFLLIKNALHPDRYLSFIPRVFYSIVILCTATWWFISFASGDLASLGPGYYLWLLSISILGVFNWIPAKAR